MASWATAGLVIVGTLLFFAASLAFGVRSAKSDLRKIDKEEDELLSACSWWSAADEVYKSKPK